MCVAVHQLANDAAGHAVCRTTATQCATCANWYCNAACIAGHIAANCGHAACPTTRATCGGCNLIFCNTCAGLWTTDICTGCTADVQTELIAGKYNVRHQLISGTGGQRRRQLSIEGPIRSVGVEDRDSPPPPLSSGFTRADDETGDIKQFDCGHLIALELDGEDDSKCIVPMMRQFNRSPGSWRTMETNIGRLIAGENLVDVNDGVVLARPPVAPTTIDLSLRTDNTVDRTWQMEVYLFYNDSVGDARIPVWFYVRIYRRQTLHAHFSLANRCTIPPAFPTAEEIAEYQAATDLFAAADGPEFTKLTADDTRPMYVRPPNPNPPPYQVLQYMEDVNDFARDNDEDAVFVTLRKLGQRGGMTPYDEAQRPTIRKFNRWRNNGQLRSDVSADWQYVGERADPYQLLSECGSRSAPEVDHVAPSYQQGANLYINARLVSFYHNHLYREKKEAGSIEVDILLINQFRRNDPKRLAFMNPAREARYWDGVERVTQMAYIQSRYWIRSSEVVAGTTSVRDFLNATFGDDALFFGADRNRNLRISTSANPYKSFRAVIIARQTFLQAHDGREIKYQAEVDLSGAYNTSIGNHQNAVADFIADHTNAERQRLLVLIGAALKTDMSPLPLCRPSDVLLPGGGEANPPPGAPVYVPPVVGTIRGTPAYGDVVERYNAVKDLE